MYHIFHFWHQQSGTIEKLMKSLPMYQSDNSLLVSHNQCHLHQLLLHCLLTHLLLVYLFHLIDYLFLYSVPRYSTGKEWIFNLSQAFFAHCTLRILQFSCCLLKFHQTKATPHIYSCMPVLVSIGKLNMLTRHNNHIWFCLFHLCFH